MVTTPEEQHVIDAAKHHIYGPLATAQDARDDLIRTLAIYDYIKNAPGPAPEAGPVPEGYELVSKERMDAYRDLAVRAQQVVVAASRVNLDRLRASYSDLMQTIK